MRKAIVLAAIQYVYLLASHPGLIQEGSGSRVLFPAQAGAFTIRVCSTRNFGDNFLYRQVYGQSGFKVIRLLEVG
ncbi:hypothetical protein [Reichenbachiella sp. MALMAid0571]|uniref:hypothetical protein n=1 Tax=Reichenbachiella sp. MALMAid0571 TaxID=3143939 RepID=UPI0032E03AB6